MHMRCGDRALKTGNEFPGLHGTVFRKSGEGKEFLIFSFGRATLLIMSIG